MAEQEEKRIIVKVAYNYFRSGNWDRALEEYKKLLDIDPLDFLVHNMLAEIYIHKNEKGEAIREFMHAASLLSATNQFDKALQAYHGVLRLDPNSREAREKIEEVVRVRMVELDDLLRRGSVKHALEICERLAERIPDHPVVKEKLAEIERRKQAGPPGTGAAPAPAASPREAEAAAGEGPLKREELVKNLYVLAELNEKKQSWDEAVEAYITILRFQPGDENARNKLHGLYRKISQQDKAREIWNRVEAEDKKRLDHAKHQAKEKPAAAPAAPAPPASGDGDQQALDKLRLEAEAKLRRAVEDRRERERSRDQGQDPAGPETAAGPRAADTGSQAGQPEQEIHVLLTQASMYIQQNLLADAMRLCQRILEMDPQNRDVRGLLQKIFEKKQF